MPKFLKCLAESVITPFSPPGGGGVSFDVDEVIS